MSWVVIRHARIGDRVREPGDVLTNDDLVGRNTRFMEETDRTIKWVDDEPASRKAASPRSRKAASPDDE